MEPFEHAAALRRARALEAPFRGVARGAGLVLPDGQVRVLEDPLAEPLEGLKACRARTSAALADSSSASAARKSVCTPAPISSATRSVRTTAA
jgi:hypothetical protein